MLDKRITPRLLSSRTLRRRDFNGRRAIVWFERYRSQFELFDLTIQLQDVLRSCTRRSFAINRFRSSHSRRCLGG